jgi:hypothetical protein
MTGGEKKATCMIVDPATGWVDAPEPVHDWQDLPYWRRELVRQPPPELAAGAHLWRRAVLYQWLEAAGAARCCRTGRVLLPPDLAPCPAERALRYACRELEEQEHGTW